MASNLERKFSDYWRLLGGPELIPEYNFHPTRKFRFDFAIPELFIGIEIQGGTWSDSRTGHNWGTGIRRDCIKANHAAMQGWTVFYFTSDMLRKANVVQNLEPVIEHVRYMESFSVDEVPAAARSVQEPIS